MGLDELPAPPLGEHWFNEEAVCVRCGFDGAEWHHLKRAKRVDASDYPKCKDHYE